MKVDITQIVMGIITLLIGVAEAFIIPWIKAFQIPPL